MDGVPVLHHYGVSDREEVLGFIHEVFPPEVSARIITQWRWRYEQNPFNPAQGPFIQLMHVGSRMIGMVAAFWLPMWMGGIECDGTGTGTWIVHPQYRGRNLWRQLNEVTLQHAPPVRIGWSRLPPQVSRDVNFLSDAMRPLLRILDPGPLLAHFTRSSLGPIGSAAGAIARVASAPFARARSDRGTTVVRLDQFDDRADALWERARRGDTAMVIRNQRYLNWRYCQRPDATYILYGVVRGSELEGFLAARLTEYLGMRWGYLVDFLVQESSRPALSSLIQAAIDEFRRLGVAAVSCFATDRAARAELFRRGFFPVPQRRPIRFVRSILDNRTDLEKFKPVDAWYLTMGDGDLELAQ